MWDRIAILGFELNKVFSCKIYRLRSFYPFISDLKLFLLIHLSLRENILTVNAVYCLHDSLRHNRPRPSKCNRYKLFLLL